MGMQSNRQIKIILFLTRGAGAQACIVMALINWTCNLQECVANGFYINLIPLVDWC